MDPPVYGNGTDACPGIGLDRGGSSRLSARYDSGAADTNVALVLVHTDSLHAGARAQQLPDLLRTESDGSDRGGIPQLASGSAAAERLSHPGRAGWQLHCVPDWSSAIPAGETIVPRRAVDQPSLRASQTNEVKRRGIHIFKLRCTPIRESIRSRNVNSRCLPALPTARLIFSI